MIPFVDLARQHRSIGANLHTVMLEAAESGQYILGDEVDSFEDEYARYCDVRHCVAVASGTAALHLGMEALGIGRGDEVIAPANTFVASILPAVRLGARAVLVDCEPRYGGIDVEQAAAAVTRRTKAIVAVHLYGHPAEVDALRELCDGFGIGLVEDACQAHGSRYRGRRVGGLGRFAAFSFYPSKNLGALGDGGAVTTDDDGLATSVRLLRNLGEERKGVHRVLGWNERLDTLQAAVLRLKLRHLDAWNERRRQHAMTYAEVLAGSGVEVPEAAPHVEHVWHLYPILSPERDELRDALARDSIATGIHYSLPVHLQEAFRELGYRRGDFPVAEARAETLLSLPMFPELERDEIERVGGAVTRYARRKSAPVERAAS